MDKYILKIIIRNRKIGKIRKLRTSKIRIRKIRIRKIRITKIRNIKTRIKNIKQKENTGIILVV